MDEFWKWLADAEFSTFSLNMLKVIRKLNGIFVPVTQSPDKIVKHPIAPAIIEQCGTQIFLANPKASHADDVEKMKVPESVYDIERNLDPSERYMVILKTPLHAGDIRPFVSMAKMDLSGLGKVTKILSGTEDNLKIFDDLYQEGMNPEEWKAKFLALAICIICYQNHVIQISCPLAGKWAIAGNKREDIAYRPHITINQHIGFHPIHYRI